MVSAYGTSPEPQPSYIPEGEPICLRPNYRKWKSRSAPAAMLLSLKVKGHGQCWVRPWIDVCETSFVCLDVTSLSRWSIWVGWCQEGSLEVKGKDLTVALWMKAAGNGTESGSDSWRRCTRRSQQLILAEQHDRYIKKSNLQRSGA